MWFHYLPSICSLPDELLIKDLVTYQSDVMTMLADRLSVGQVPWDYEWRRLARQLKIPYAVYRKFEWKPRKRRKSPTKKVLQWLVERIPDITLTEIIAVLDKIKCSHAIQIIKEHFPNTVGEYSTWEHRAPVHSCYVWPWFRFNRPSLPQTYPPPPPNPLDENCSYRAWIAIYLTYDTIAWRIRLRVLHYFTQGLSRASELKNRENRNPRRRGRKTNSSKNREFSIRIGTLEKNLKSNVLRYRGSAIASNHGHFEAVNNCQRCIKLRFRRTLAAVAARSRKQRVCIDVLHNVSSADI